MESTWRCQREARTVEQGSQRIGKIFERLNEEKIRTDFIRLILREIWDLDVRLNTVSYFNLHMLFTAPPTKIARFRFQTVFSKYRVGKISGS